MVMENDGSLLGDSGAVERALEMADEAAGGQSGGIPGSEDVLVNYGQGQQSLPVFMLTGSDKPENYLLRGRLTESDLNDMTEILADYNTIHLGDPDMLNLFAFKANGSAGIGGQARNEAVRIATHAIIAPFAQGVGQVASRMRRNYNQQNNRTGAMGG
jgi:hypothetical protein